MKAYHETTNENMERIAQYGVIKTSCGGVVYLCKRPEDACKFLLIRGLKKMCVIEVNVENKKIHESNDHSEAFFRCKAYMHDGEIELTGREKIEEWTFDI